MALQGTGGIQFHTTVPTDGQAGDVCVVTGGAEPGLYRCASPGVWAAAGSGTPGPQGPQGLPGADGAAGPAGTPGVQGIQGIQGPAGDAGAAGPQGIQGIQGPEGPAGPTTWAGITDKPATFTPATHAHAAADVTGTAVLTNDARLSDARTPTAHNQAETTITFTDVATGDASASAHGFLPKLGGGTANFLRADGAWAAPAGGSDPFMAKLVLAADKPTGANTTPVTTGLSFNYVANSWYAIDIYALVAPGAATTGCGFNIDVSAAVTYVGVHVTHQLAATGTLSGSTSVGDAAVTLSGVSSGHPATATYPVIGGGILVTGANAGTATFFFRSETTAVTTCKAGTMIRVQKVA